jgi:hypothetical protein
MQPSTMTLPVQSSHQVSVRYQRLLECLPIALAKCYAKIDVEHAIQICYGSSNKNDIMAKSSTGSDNDIFCTMLRDNILQQQLHIEVSNDVVEFLQNHNVQEKLYQLETIIRKVDSDISAKENEDRKDKASALMALQKANSNGAIVSPKDIVQYQSYKNLVKKKDSLQLDIEQMELKIQKLQNELRQQQRSFSDTNIHAIQAMQIELEQSADLCSMIR